MLENVQGCANGLKFTAHKIDSKRAHICWQMSKQMAESFLLHCLLKPFVG